MSVCKLRTATVLEVAERRLDSLCKSITTKSEGLFVSMAVFDSVIHVKMEKQ